MLDYNHEAAGYDSSRGGDPRADAAAEAVRALLPPDAGVVVDAGCGTGIVTTRLRAPGRRVLGFDLSGGMLGVARQRLPGGVARADAGRLPLGDASCNAVVLVWLLHLLDGAASAQVIAEAARVLRPGGVLVTTVDKNEGHMETGSDVALLVAPVRARWSAAQTDAMDRVVALAAGRGLTLTAQARFVGHGQGRSPRHWREGLPDQAWAAAADRSELDALRHGLAGLPEQDVARADPRYRLVALSR